MVPTHRVLMGVLLLGNAIGFAGVDSVSRALTAAIVLIMVVAEARWPPVPGIHRWCAVGFAVLVGIHLVPLPEVVRRALQPGFVEVMPAGWATLSLAPWSTVQVAASAVIAAGIAVAAARMAAARTGLPVLLVLLAATGGLLALLGFASEPAAPAKVLLVRDNTGGGSPYGPFVNANHFAQAIELTVPAALVLVAAGARGLGGSGAGRQRSAMVLLVGAAATVVGCAAVLRSGSRGGILFLAVAALATLPLWRRSGGRQAWWVPPLVVAIVAATTVLAATRLPAVRDQFSTLLLVEGVEGNSRWDLWHGTWRSWMRAPILGSGPGSYRHVIGLDKPATGTLVLERAHSDWLEWLSTSGVIGFAILAAAAAALAVALRPRRLRSLRHEHRYPLAGAALALLATGLHELIGFGLQTPLNRYLLAAWIGLVWGLAGRHGTRPSGDPQ